jgi:hypothetical protein
VNFAPNITNLSIAVAQHHTADLPATPAQQYNGVCCARRAKEYGTVPMKIL